MPLITKEKTPLQLMFEVPKYVSVLPLKLLCNYYDSIM